MIRRRTLALPIIWAFTLVILSGCATEPLRNIPSSATIAGSGNDQLSFTAPSSGRIWVYDVTYDHIDYFGPLRTNESITVDPRTNSVTINGSTISDILVQGAQHRIYFVATEDNPS
jgi:hypothetical protein